MLPKEGLGDTCVCVCVWRGREREYVHKKIYEKSMEEYVTEYMSV